MLAYVVTVGYWLAVAGVAASVVYYWLTLAAALRFAASGKVSPSGPLQPATVIIPLKGAGEDLEYNLSGFCRLDYPRFQLVFAMESAEDPALPIVRRVAKAFPAVDIEIVVSSRRVGPNPKENNHANALTAAKHPWIVLTDGDVQVEPGYLRAVAAPLADPGTGLVTCPYRFAGPGPLWSRLKALTIHAGFVPSVMLACWLAPVRFGLGATLALRREVLDKIGGFEAVADFLASDYWLANKAAALGYRVKLLPYWLIIRLEPLDWRGYRRFQLRWFRTMRFTTPAGYAGLVTTLGLPWSLGLLALSGGSPAGWSGLAVLLASRFAAAALIWKRCFGIIPLSWLALLPLHDLLYAGLWAWGFVDSRVYWAGREFRLGDGTRIRTR